VGHLDAECSCSLQVDDELELGRLQDREVCGLRALEDLTGVDADPTTTLDSSASLKRDRKDARGPARSSPETIPSRVLPPTVPSASGAPPLARVAGALARRFQQVCAAMIAEALMLKSWCNWSTDRLFALRLSRG
jgi:hypothetical protein